ncbi:MAG: hypothetical protein AAB415_03155 [Patescibacteria group bacterium]
MSQLSDMDKRREEARLAMEGDERRAARAAREKVVEKRRVEARLAMESATHRARREVLERAERESREVGEAARAAETAKRQAAERAAAEADARIKAATATQEAAKMARLNITRRAAAEIKSLTDKPTHLNAIRTLKTDMATAVNQGASIASSIIQNRGQGTPQREPSGRQSHALRTVILILFLLGTLAAGGVFFFREQVNNLLSLIPGLMPHPPAGGPIGPLNGPNSKVETSIITADQQLDIPTANQTIPALVAKIRAAVTTNTAAGTVTELVFSDNEAPLPFRAWQTLLGLSFPADLTRIVAPNFMFGLYSDSTSRVPFIILQTKSAAQSYGQLLAWEKNLPAVWDTLVGKPVAASSTVENASGGLTRFRDQLIQNLDTRILDGASVTQPAIYGFPDQNTIILTQTSETFLEILKRFRMVR